MSTGNMHRKCKVWSSRFYLDARAVYAMALCLSVCACLSICLSQVGALLK